MNLQHFFSPKTIALIGASRNPKKLGNRILRNIRDGGFRGHVFPVNPSTETILGLHSVASVKDIRGAVDLAIIVTPAETVPGLVRECGKKGIRNCVIISAGFREMGRDGAEREALIAALAKQYHMRLLGPNCLGFVHGDFHLNASFGEGIPSGGNLAFISQSGATAVAITDWAQQAGVRFRAIVSLGNKAGLSETELLEYFSADKKTTAVLLYLESCEHGQAFLDAARRCRRTKPIIVLKAGVSELGQRAAISHTGALASSRDVFSAAMKNAGILEVYSLEELSDAARAFSQPHPISGNRIAVVTNAGGPGIMAADAVAATSLTLATLSETTIRQLRRVLPPSASIANPVDLIGDADAERYRRALGIIARDPGVDGLAILLTPQVVTESRASAQAIIRLARKNPKKVFVASFVGGNAVRGARKLLDEAGVLQFSYPENAIAAFEHLWLAQQRPRVVTRPPSPAKSKIKGDGLVMPPAAHRLLRSYGFHTVTERFIRIETELDGAARAVGFPLALKLISKKAIHKSQSHAVWTGISSPRELHALFRTAKRRFGKLADHEGWLVQKMTSDRIEWFLGGKRDPSFGPVILIGAGGTDVESTRGVTTLLLPLSASEIRTEIEALCAAHPALRNSDVPAIVRAVLQLGRLLNDNPDVSEIDINPLLVGMKGKGADVIDARIVVQKA